MAFINALYNLWPSGDKLIPGLRDAIAADVPTVLPKYGISSNLVLAHFMAQISLECGAGTEVEENLNYSAPRMHQVWPSRFPTVNSGLPYAHNPRLLANKVYNGRGGNALNSNMGYAFRGRGATQTTFHDGYKALQEALAKNGIVLDLVTNPDLVNAPEHFLECGAADFILCGCLLWAQADNVVQVTRHLNGGYTGLSDRMTWLRRWKAALDTVS
jgi:putative chitinase